MRSLTEIITESVGWGHVIFSEQRIIRFMQIVNLISLPFAVLPVLFYNMIGINVVLSTKYNYLYSIYQFIPDIFLFGFYEPMPITAWNIRAAGIEISVYFPGVAVECILGIIQGIILGMLILKRGPSGNIKAPILPSFALFSYAIMCVAALPLHCLKDISLFDIESESLLTRALFWIDTFGTGMAPPIMFLSGLIECQYVDQKKKKLIWSLILPVYAALTFFGVFLPSRWITFFLHIANQTTFLTPLILMTRHRVRELGCQHGYRFMALAKVGSLLLAYCNFLLPCVIFKVMRGKFCSLTACFAGCRVGMVNYCAYCLEQQECHCWHGTKGGKSKKKD